MNGAPAILPRYTSVIPSAGHDPSSASTRQRLIEAAIDTFGKRGFEATTTRRLAELAGTQLTAIAYHFVNKEGIYQAAAEHIAEGMQARVKEDVQKAAALVEKEDLPRAAAMEAAAELLQRLAEMLIGPEIPDSWSRFISREMAEPTSAFNHIYAGMADFAETLCRLVAYAQDQTHRSLEARVLTVTLVGQVLVFRSSRAAALRILDKDSLGRSELEVVQRTIRSNVMRFTYLEGK